MRSVSRCRFPLEPSFEFGAVWLHQCEGSALPPSPRDRATPPKLFLLILFNSMVDIAGNFEVVTSDRAATDSSLQTGQFIVVDSFDGEYYKLDVFAAADKNYAEVLSKSRKCSADLAAAGLTPAQVADSQMNIIKQVYMKRKSFASCCTGWRRLIGERPQEAPPPPPPLRQNLVGKMLSHVPVVDSEDTSVAVVLRTARVVEQDGDVLTVDDGVDEDTMYIVKYGTALPLLAGPPRVSIDASCVGADLRRVLRQMHFTGRGSQNVVDAEELQQLAVTCGAFPFTCTMLRGSDLDSAEFRFAAASLLNELVSKLDGKVLGDADKWPCEPEALGAAIKQRAAGSAFQQIEQVEQVAPKPLPPAHPADVSRYPLASALRTRCVSSEEWDQFMRESVHFTAQPSTQDKRDWLLAAASRAMKALDQFLQRHGRTVDGLQSLDAGQSASALEDFAADVGADSQVAVGGGAVSQQSSLVAMQAAAGDLHAASIGEQLSSLLGQRAGGSSKAKVSNSAEEMMSAMREAAKRLRVDEAAVARLHEMRQLCIARDFSALAQLKSKETNQDVLLLVDAGTGDEDDIRSTLAGELGDGTISLIVGVRAGLNCRLMHRLFPRKPDRSERQSKAIGRIRLGRLTGTHLLHLLDMDDAGTKEQPLKSFAALGEGAEAQLRHACAMLQRIVSLSSPAQTDESMEFFALLPDVIVRYRQHGASWTQLSSYVKEIFIKMEKPALTFARGGGCEVFINLDVRLLERTTVDALELDDSMRLSERKATQSAVKSHKETAKEKTKAPGDGSSKHVSLISKKEQLCAAVPKVGSKEPCVFHFVFGNCRNTAADCKGHHGKGAQDAGSFTPK